MRNFYFAFDLLRFILYFGTVICLIFESHVWGTIIIGKIFRSYYVFGDFVLLAFRKEVDGAPVSFYPTIVRSIITFFLEYPTRVRLSTGKN